MNQKTSRHTQPLNLNIPDIHIHTYHAGIYELQIEGALSSHTPQSFLDSLWLKFQYYDRMTGLVVNISRVDNISLLKLGSLIERFEDLDIPVAIVFRNAQQRRLATLLQAILSPRQIAIYCLSRSEAMAFLAQFQAPPPPHKEIL